jgi:hypothetical protein
MGNVADSKDGHRSSAADPVSAPESKASRNQAALERRERVKQRARALAQERKTPLPPHVAMVKYQRHVAILEKRPDAFVLRASADTVHAYPVSGARAGRLVAGRIFLTAPDGSTAKVRVYPAGDRAPSELGSASNTGGSGWDNLSGLGDDPISMVIALVVCVVAVVLLPVVIWFWLKGRGKRNAAAARVLTAPAPDVPGPTPTRSG